VIAPFIVTDRKTSSWKPGAIVNTAPVFTVRSRHSALATPDVEGAFGIPAAMMTSVDDEGAPALQLPPVLQLELTTPVQVVWPAAADETSANARTRTGYRAGMRRMIVLSRGEASSEPQKDDLGEVGQRFSILGSEWRLRAFWG
jgi:hypothetical protein